MKVTAPLSGKMSQLDFKILYRYPKFLMFEVIVIVLLEVTFQEVFPVFPANLTVLGKSVPGNLDFQFSHRVKLIVQNPTVTEMFE